MPDTIPSTVCERAPEDVGYVVPLSRGVSALVSECDYARVSQFKWCVFDTTHGWYAGRKDEHGKTVLLHRFVLDAPPRQFVDHIHGDTLDCRRSQLRFATASQNSANRRAKKGGASSHLGVDRRPNGRWRAKIREGGKQISLGSYATEAEAALAYNLAATRVHGAFARLNQVPEGTTPVRCGSRLSEEAVSAILTSDSTDRRTAQRVADEFDVSSQYVRRLRNQSISKFATGGAA